MALLCLVAAPLFAQALPDPTRPPAWVDAGAAAADEGAPVLQSVMISPQRRAAMISGQVVELGGRFGDARLVAVSESGVVLRNESGKQELKLLPAVDKRPAGMQAEKTKAGTMEKQAPPGVRLEGQR
jgi:MSHA biogenesis protein MshK